jgi:hypothetical protein
MGSTNISQPATPAAPTVGQSASEYAASLPTIYNAQLQYQPQFEQQNLDLIKNFAPQYKAIQDALYPELGALDKTLASQAQAGMTGEMSDAMKQKYQDQFRAEVGANAGSGIGADYVSRNMITAAEGYKQQNQNLALTLTGRQPLYQASNMQPAYNATQNYNYGVTSGFQANGYQNYSQGYSSMYRANGDMKLGMNQIYQGYAKMGMQGAGAMMA